MNYFFFHAQIPTSWWSHILFKVKKQKLWPNRCSSQCQTRPSLVKQFQANCCFLSLQRCPPGQGLYSLSRPQHLIETDSTAETGAASPCFPVCLSSAPCTRPPTTWSSSPQSVLSFSSCSALAALPPAAVANCCNVPQQLSCAFSQVTVNLLLMTSSLLKQGNIGRLDCLAVQRKLKTNPSSELKMPSKKVSDLFSFCSGLSLLFSLETLAFYRKAYKYLPRLSHIKTITIF